MGHSKGVTPRAQDFSAWYNEVIQRAELADYSPVRGCMVIRPAGYAVWEQMQQALDRMFKETGHQNAYFPLFIPQSFLAREAEHVEGFAKEVALVTHTRLRATGRAGAEAVEVDPESALEEPLVVRPTSETIIYAMLAKWIQSYRDLPVLLNQWANVVRWELRTRPFLRTTEFLWQEGHTAHATAAEAEAEARLILGVYRRFMEEWMAMPVLTGAKSDAEKFAGAERTYALEALMQDNRALQAGTSHFLGQNFARAFGVQFQTATGGLDYVWSTSWGVSTRLIGGLIMTHGDDTGFVCPPRLAQWQVVVVPIYRSEAERASTFEAADRVVVELQRAGLRALADRREELTPGAKYYYWETRGVPIRLELGPRDLTRESLVLVRRTGGEKESVPLGEVAERVPRVLNDLQRELLETARARREQQSIRGASRADLIERMSADEGSDAGGMKGGGGGFVYGGWCGSSGCEAEIKEQTKATIRVLPDPEFRSNPAPTHCLWCGARSLAEAVWAKAY
jgi:prolyl-tRNA synthetase